MAIQVQRGKERTNGQLKKTTAKSVAKKTNGQKISKKHEIKHFPIVGIGGSAGGLEAFSRLLEHLKPDLGMAYVYIQHLSSSHESFLPEILQRKTTMPVEKVHDNQSIQKNHVYVIPAKHLVAIVDGKLKLERKIKNQQLNAIDHFMNMLAPLYQQNAIGILLSGTGTDGTMGLMSIKSEGGITFAQDDTAGYQGMPHNAAEMGYVDFVMPPEKIAQELALMILHPTSVTSAKEQLDHHRNDLRKIHMIMNSKRGIDFSHYKQSTIHRRILRRMALHKIKSMNEYAQLLKDEKIEVDALYQDLLITVTDFFRDSVMYQGLATKVLPAILKNRKQSDIIRIWIPGCATGEEAVSFAIVMLEFLGEKAISIPIQIFATDLNERAIERARSGMYSKAAVQNVSPQRLRRFFIKNNSHYQVVKAIRDMCVFAPHNLLKDPPFSRMDIISCQNVLIYLESGPQTKIMHAFHYALKSTGFLLLGKSETIGSSIELFQQINKQFKIYTKCQVNSHPPMDFIMRNQPPPEIPEDNGLQTLPSHKEPDLEKEADKLLLSRYVPASVLVNKDLDIIRFRGAISKFIEPASGKASLHLLKMIREELAFDMRTVLHRAKKDGRPAKKEGIIIGTDGGSQELGIEVSPIKGPGKEVFYLIVFRTTSYHEESSGTKVSRKGKGPVILEKRVVNLESQLREAKENIRVITEDFEATREELQSANEEVLSSNEELQSINEELETSKEELQSTNEELTTINEELQIRNTELKDAGDYTKAIVETMHESLIMLTDDLRIRSANKGFYQTFHTTPEETEGAFLYDLGNHQWEIPELRKQLKMVQSRDIPFTHFEVTSEFPTIGKKTMLLNAIKFPGKEGSEALILLAIQDITERKNMEEELKENEEKLRLLVQNSSDIITVFDRDGTIKYESPAIESILGYKPEDRIGRNISTDPIVHPDDRKIKVDLLRKAVNRKHENLYGEFRLRHKNGSYRVIEAIFRNLLDNKKIEGIIANYRDATDRKMLEKQKDEFIGIASHELKTPVTSIKAYTQILEENFRKSKDDHAAELLHKVNDQVDRLTVLIVDLLDFTRIEGGKLKFREENYDLNELIFEVCEEMQRTTRTHVIVKKLDRSIKMRGDRYRTGQVLTNLLSNAIKYSPKAKKIIVSSKIKTDAVTVCVQDFGIGIKEELIGKVFDKFFRVSEPVLNTFPGLGLGLYIAAEIVRRQGGKIEAKNTSGKGMTFCFTLPKGKRTNINAQD
jgi:two-component system CheB/CheR fusion protein